MNYREATCPACGLHIAAPFFDGGLQPLATLSWPASAAAAQALPRLPLDFVRCVDCGHVFNAAFDYQQVPYSEKPNLMFNRAANWSRFIGEAQRRMLAHLPERPVVVEIGHGDGSFLETLAALRPGGRYVGFDPHGSTRSGAGAELRAELFTAARHLEELQPHMVVSRHVLEHLSNPLGFLQGLSFAAASLDLATLAYFEVPCIDQAIETRRTVDFYYEHSSQFTTGSFTRMLSRTAAELIEVGHGYGNEVIYGFVRLGTPATALGFARDSLNFATTAAATQQRIADQVTTLHQLGKRIAVWGGTGKSAAFICRYGLDRDRFPVVVDSDPAKAGTFVPGMGQEIRLRDYLLAHPADIVIIPPQWRAADIVLEMSQLGIAVDTVLIEHDGELIDFHRAPHPYRP
ncbi:MAG: hypothetical protein U1E21_13670 [Reyranellaceae bacterium]